MNVSEIPQTPEKMFIVIAIILGIGFIVAILYAIYQLFINK